MKAVANFICGWLDEIEICKYWNIESGIIKKGAIFLREERKRRKEAFQVKCKLKHKRLKYIFFLLNFKKIKFWYKTKICADKNLRN